MVSRTCLSLSIILSLVLSIKPQAISQQGSNASGTEPPTNDDELQDDYNHVLSLKFHLRRSKVVELLTKLVLLETRCPIQQCNVSAIDIVEAIQIDKYSNVDIANAIGKMNITGRDAYNLFLIYDMSVPAIESLLPKAGITFSELYKNFVDTLASPSESVPNILGVVNVSVFEFMNAQAYGNDTLRLQVLATGNYSYENVEKVLNITNKTGIDILRTLPLNTTAKQIRNFDAAAFSGFVKNAGIKYERLVHFYNYLNVTLINFIAYPGFIQILTDFESFLNPEEVLATAVSRTKLFTINKAKSLATFKTDNSEFIRNYSYFQAENIKNPVVHYHINNLVDVKLTNPEFKSNDIALIEVSNPYMGNITDLALSYDSSSFFNCTYVTKLYYGEMSAENFTDVDLRSDPTVIKSNTTVYNLGSPLFCKNKLVGMATVNGTNFIKFATFENKSGETTKPPGQKTSSSHEHVTTPNSVTVSEPGTGSMVTVSIACLGLLIASWLL